MSKLEDLPESPGRKALRLRVEQRLRGIAEAVAPHCPPGFGFMVMIFEFGDGGSISHISNGERQTVAAAVEEWLARVHGHDLATENYRLRRKLEELEAK